MNHLLIVTLRQYNRPSNVYVTTTLTTFPQRFRVFFCFLTTGRLFVFIQVQLTPNPDADIGVDSWAFNLNFLRMNTHFFLGFILGL